MQRPDMVRLEESQIPAVALALARGFNDDPVARHMVPDPGQREPALALHFAALLRMGHLFGEVDTTPDAQGAAVWFPPGGWQLTPGQLEEAGITRLEQELPDGAFARFAAVLEHGEKLHERDVPEPHWYLCLIGVDRALQGKGLGTALLGKGLERADAQRVPCYLETAAEGNGPFYRRHGFEVAVDEIEPSSGLRLWTFLRPAR